jgi:quinol-cytochrome oxidoreductase complex cytochrome b subunit/coenzyme F420-reducing hydrogenase delta subunit
MKNILRKGFECVEDWFDAIFGPAWNPFYQFGALGWFYYWIVIISGLYLYIFFDTGITDAYQSVEYLTHDQWYAGGVMRSLHRYASDAMVIMMMMHLLREFAMDRFRSSRWFAWFTGIPMLWFVFFAGITGYWMVWDVLAQYIAIVTTEWLDALPIFGESIARNFLSDATLSGRFFTLMVFLHIALPLFLLFIMWIHIHRHTLPKVNPPLGLAVGTFTMLLAVSFYKPAISHPPADLGTVPAEVGIDWFYMPIYPLLDHFQGGTIWIVLGAITLLLLLLPWLPPGKHNPVAVVDLNNCNGCGRCVADCPFSAISMGPRSDNSSYEQEAIVDEKHCVSCGICVGACPTATPFRRRSELLSGIELPAYTISELREKTIAATINLTGDDRIIVFGCENSIDIAHMEGRGVGVVTMPCIGMLPPSFIDFVLSKKHADGIFLTGCREGDCYFRLGLRWTDERIDRERDPNLRQRVPRERICIYWAGLTRSKQFFKELDAFRNNLKALSTRGQNTPELDQNRDECEDVCNV